MEKVKKVTAKVPTVKARTAFEGFMDFVRKQGVVGLAIGLAIGTQAAELVKSIVSSVITPFVDLLVGSGGLKDFDLFVRIASRSTTFEFGLLIDALLKFLAVAVVIYFVVMGLKLDKIDKKKD